MSLVPHGRHPHHPFARGFDSFGRSFEHDLARFEPGFAQYWRDNMNELNVGKEFAAVVNDEKKFAVSIDVSHFKPEELKVKLDGQLLSIEAHQEIKDEHNFLQRAFTRKWTVPNDVNVQEIKTSLSENGHLTIEAPKKGQASIRHIPITPALKH